MATPIWNNKEKRWTLRTKKDGVERKFTSVRPGLAGKKEVLRRYREWDEYGSTTREKATVNVVWKEFLDEYAMRKGSNSEQYRQHEKIGRLYLIPALGNKRVSNITRKDLQDIINLSRPHNGRTNTLSKKYLTTIRATLNAFINYSYENGYCEPLRGELYIPEGRPVIGKKILQPHDIRKLFEPSDLTYHKALCFMCATGMRPGEVIGLQWSDIQDNQIVISRAVNSKGIITHGKTSNARRNIPMNAIVRKLIDEQREATKDLRSKWIFCSKIGAMGSQSTMRHQLDQLCKERGIDASPYELRHTYVSMVKNEMPEQMVRALVGHGIHMDTFGVYGHMVDGELKQAAEISELVFKDLTQIDSNLKK